MANFSKVNFKTLFLIVILFISACASIQQPTGGPKDKEPPKVVKETPKNLSRNFSAKQIQIQFNEFIKLSNEFKEISISPETERLPIYKAKKSVLTIKFQDTLLKNTTYTINFGNGIVDYNEGNILKNYSYVFSTGNIIDSLSISGTITNALTKEPELDATVFIIPVEQDTIFGKKKAPIYTTTDSSGNYKLKNLRSDKYFIYALKEEGGDRIYNSTNEFIGFRKDTILLSKDLSEIDMEVFKEEPAALRILDRKIENDGRILITFNKSIPDPSLSIIEPANLNTSKNVEFSSKNDSAMLWLPEMNFDSLKVSIQSATKSLDTIVLRRGKKDTYNRTYTITDNISSGGLKPKTDLHLTFSGPVSGFDGSKIKLSEDSIPKRAQVIKDSTSTRKYYIRYPWKQNKSYKIDLAENAFFNKSTGAKNKIYSKTFTLNSEENYGNLTLDIKVPEKDKNYIVQLLNENNEVIRTDSLDSDGKINYLGFQVGTFRIRILYDENKNGKWDTGNVKQRIQPEKVWNYDKEITLRANWDLEEKITIPNPAETN
ncbi:Ig-like domain-containing domain [Rubrolithibacter danxiaensis]|uniref:Ig-like domain-containing domain n=1 Tax=Rubrolithibacter danxiaensis TaxID=3390805 RepID=UPI003BF8C78E